MSEYLGFKPTTRPNYFFVSYNSEDCARVGKVASQLFHADVPLWYDYGLEYGEKWETQISGKIKDTQAMLLFFTKGILEKENSYVRKEYEMATKYFGRRVYVIMMDKIESDMIPYDKVPWWIDIQEHQSVDVTELPCDKAAEKILEAVGVASHEEKMNLLIKEYRKLYDNGDEDEAERFLTEYLRGQNLSGKAQLIANIVCGGMPGSIIGSPAVEVKDTEDENILKKINANGKNFYECFQLTVKNTEFTIVNEEIGANPSGPDPHIVRIWRSDEMIQGVYGFWDAVNMKVFYDKYDDIIFISLKSTVSGEQNISIITAENPAGETVCNTFRNVRKVC